MRALTLAGGPACQRADLCFLVQLVCFSLHLLLVIAIQALDVIYCGLEVLHGYAAFYLPYGMQRMS